MSDLFGLTSSSAYISPDGVYRYDLQRRWGPGGLLTFVMLNPSTADDNVDDPTIRRCRGFAQREGLDGLRVVNLFAHRSTDPDDLLATSDDPVGPHNGTALDDALVAARLAGTPVVAAWGAWVDRPQPDNYLLNLLATRVQIRRRAVDAGVDLVCLGTTKSGAPRHPLYVKASQPLERLA